MNEMEFYDELATDYDQMTRFQERLATEERTLGHWKARYGFASALDAACGTGLHAILLSRLGVRSVGADISAGMLQQARRHAEQAQVSVEWVQVAFSDLSDRFPASSFDAVFCLGNSIPHVLGDRELRVAVENFRSVLRPGGILAVQVLNYARILEKGERIIGVNESGPATFVRFYDFLENERVRFNILTILKDAKKLNHSLRSTTLRTYRLADLSSTLAEIGFVSVETYGDLRFAPFQQDTSANLVIVAQAPV